MPAQSDESKAFQLAVYETTKLIPLSRVTTYGHIAKLLNKPGNSRQVGQCLKQLHLRPKKEEYGAESVPWWRVINSQGKISERGIAEMSRQREKLREEAVLVNDSYGVRLAEYGWFPEEIEWD